MQTEITELSKELTPSQRAIVALKTTETEIKLRDLVKLSTDIVIVNNMDGRDQAHRIAMNISNMRVAIAKNGKAARADATAYSKAVIAEEQRLIEIIEPEEIRVFKLRDDFDAKIEAEKQAKIAAERARTDAIKVAIARIAGYPVSVAGKPSGSIRGVLEPLRIAQLPESVFEEFLTEAEIAKANAIEILSGMLESALSKEAAEEKAQQERDAEAARIKAQAEENERMRAELEILRVEQARIAAEAAKQSAIELQIERDKIYAAQAEIARRQTEIDAVAAQNRAEAERIENDRLDAEAEKEAEIARIAYFHSMSHEEKCMLEVVSVHIPTNDDDNLINLGRINATLGFTVSADFLAQLGFTAKVNKNAKLYRESDFQSICDAIIRHVQSIAATPIKDAA